ncbi:hypothetical protein FQR65_LT08539 [Abscondita terminalis]|nr:hypothetical protein FQR65_LT08539 [Abscondita terminalis]
MQLFGINFAPVDTPMRRRLQTLAAGLGFSTFVFGGVVGAIFLLYVILYTHHWPEAIIYLIWILIIDKDICNQGGRRVEWARRWKWWQYVKEYYPIRFERVPWVQLDPKRNYLFCCFPHGIVPQGVFSAFCDHFSDFRELFPFHTPHLCVLGQLFYSPILRELMLAVGMCSVAARSLEHILSAPHGGNVAALVVGGAEETFYSQPGQYSVVLKNRKGFVKIAIKNGTPLVPVYSFGENDVFKQLDNPKGSLLRRVQDWIKSVTGVAPVLPLGRGYFQYSFGLVPLRKPICTIVGQPIDVVKTPYPTQEQIDTVHNEFIKQLVALFEEQKHNYLKDSENAHLVIL